MNYLKIIVHCTCRCGVVVLAFSAFFTKQNQSDQDNDLHHDDQEGFERLKERQDPQLHVRLNGFDIKLSTAYVHPSICLGQIQYGQFGFVFIINNFVLQRAGGDINKILRREKTKPIISCIYCAVFYYSCHYA